MEQLRFSVLGRFCGQTVTLENCSRLVFYLSAMLILLILILMEVFHGEVIENIGKCSVVHGEICLVDRVSMALPILSFLLFRRSLLCLGLNHDTLPLIVSSIVSLSCR